MKSKASCPVHFDGEKEEDGPIVFSPRTREDYISMLRPRTNEMKPSYVSMKKKWERILEEALKEMGPYCILTEEERAWKKDSALKPWSPVKYAILQRKLRRIRKELYGEEDE